MLLWWSAEKVSNYYWISIIAFWGLERLSRWLEDFFYENVVGYIIESFELIFDVPETYKVFYGSFTKSVSACLAIVCSGSSFSVMRVFEHEVLYPGKVEEITSVYRGAIKSLNMSLNCFLLLNTFLWSLRRFLASKRSSLSRVLCPSSSLFFRSVLNDYFIFNIISRRFETSEVIFVPKLSSILISVQVCM